MKLRINRQIAALLAIVSTCHFASADNSLLQISRGDERVDLVTGTDGIVLGQGYAEVTGDTVVVTFNMTGIGDDCCLKDTHVCNMPPLVSNIEDEGCLKAKTASFSVMDVFGFMCTEPFDRFQFNGHASVICDSPLRGDLNVDTEPGDPLPNGIGQGNYGEQEYCYGAMYDVGLVCGQEPPTCDFMCESPAEPCGGAHTTDNHAFCFCSQAAAGEGYCWQDIGCFVPIFYLTTTPGVPCESDAVCKGGTRCVPSTCCGDSYCLPTCFTFADKGLDNFAERYGISMDEMNRAMECSEDSCTFPSGRGKIFTYEF